MRKTVEFSIDRAETFLHQLLNHHGEDDFFCLFNSNGFHLQNKLFSKLEGFQELELMAGVGCLHQMPDTGLDSFKNLQDFHDVHKDWMMGYLSYDLKNELEDLSSDNYDGIQAKALSFFIPRFVLILKEKVVQIHYRPSENSRQDVLDYFLELSAEGENRETAPSVVALSSRMSKKTYLEKIELIKKHLQRGDVYEMNYCQEFYAEEIDIDPVQVYRRLVQNSPSPFSNYLKCGDIYVLSASPERYIRKIGNKVFTQPIKGTAKRHVNKLKDEGFKEALLQSEKERSENVMIVDLCRNDLSRFAARGSVKVEELFGIYSFPHVHQMISTISAELPEGCGFSNALKWTFPMGSMTGAPKVRAMELIEELELTKRGIFSGAIGYVDPKGDLDFNVVIRTVLYNQSKQYLSISVGGAITILSNPEREYEECLLKLAALKKVLSDEKRKVPI